MVLPAPAPRTVTPLLSSTELPSPIVNVPAPSCTTWPAGQLAMAVLMLAVSFWPAPRGVIVAQTVVRFGMPPTDSMPAIFQLALASLSDGKIVEDGGGEATSMPSVPETQCTRVLSQATTVTLCGPLFLALT